MNLPAVPMLRDGVSKLKKQLPVILPMLRDSESFLLANKERFPTSGNDKTKKVSQSLQAAGDINLIKIFK